MSPASQNPNPSPLRGAARREAIIMAAIQIMTEIGAGRLTMIEVAKRASASKETVYRHFGDRTGLLVAVLTVFAKMNIAACPHEPDNESFEDGLRRLGSWYLTMATRPEVLSFYRYVVGASEEIPKLGEAFTKNVTRPVVTEIEHYLQQYGYNDQSSFLAEAYLGLLQGKFWNRALVEPGLTITDADVKKQVHSASELFAQAFRQ